MLYICYPCYLDKTCILSRYYLEAIYKINTIYILPKSYPIFLLPILYPYFLLFFCIFKFEKYEYKYIHTYIYISTHTHIYTVYTSKYLVFFAIMCQYNPHTPDRTRSQGAGRGGGREDM